MSLNLEEIMKKRKEIMKKDNDYIVIEMEENEKKDESIQTILDPVELEENNRLKRENSNLSNRLNNLKQNRIFQSRSLKKKEYLILFAGFIAIITLNDFVIASLV